MSNVIPGGYQPFRSGPYNGLVCPTCNAETVPSAILCVKCGTPLSSPRSKGVAVVLAVILSSTTWLYTYRRDATKFWVGFALNLIGIMLTGIDIGFAFLLGVWIWANVDTAIKGEHWFQLYPNPVPRA